MKRKILIALLLVLIVGTGAGIGTWANYFKSIESTNNSLNSAKFEFNVDKLDDTNNVTPWQNIAISGDKIKPGSNSAISLADYQLDFDVKVPTEIDLVFDANNNVDDFFKQTVNVYGGSSETYFNSLFFDVIFYKKDDQGTYQEEGRRTISAVDLLNDADKKMELNMFDGQTDGPTSYRCEVALRWVDNDTRISIDERTKVSIDTLFQNKQGTFNLRFEAIQK